jgi:RNA polymerase sigma-70 factor (ECF subfamily)
MIADPEGAIAMRAEDSRSLEFTPDLRKVLAALSAGDSRAFDTIYLRFFEPIRAFFLLLLHNEAEAEELCQELFVRLWENREKVNPDLNFKSFFYTVAKSMAMKHLRHKQVIDKYTNFRLRENPDLEEAADEGLMENELSLLLRISLENMPEQRRRVFELSRFENLTNEEIASRLNIRESTVRAHLHLALKELRERLTVLLLFVPIERMDLF